MESRTGFETSFTAADHITLGKANVVLCSAPSR